MTLLHAMHMIIGLGILTTLLIMGSRRSFRPITTGRRGQRALLAFVDIVWIFLFRYCI